MVPKSFQKSLDLEASFESLISRGIFRKIHVGLGLVRVVSISVSAFHNFDF